MSFFNDFINDIGFKGDDIYCSVAFGKGISFTGKYKIVLMEEFEIKLSAKKQIYRIVGKDLSVKSMSKGEIFIQGNVCGVLIE